MTEGTPDQKQNMNNDAKVQDEPYSGAGDARNGANNTNEDKKEDTVENMRQGFVEVKIYKPDKAEETKQSLLKEYRRLLSIHMEAAISVLMTEVTSIFKDVTLPVRMNQLLFNRMHYVIYSRIVGMDLGDLLQIRVSTIVRIYRRNFKKQGDINFLIEHYYKIEQQLAVEAADIANANTIPAGNAAVEVDAAPIVDIERQDEEDAVNPPGPSAQ